jgi:glutamate synthase domain-containing protein 2
MTTSNKIEIAFAVEPHRGAVKNGPRARVLRIAIGSLGINAGSVGSGTRIGRCRGVSRGGGPMIEIKLSRGAKPGHGAVVPGPKVERKGRRKSAFGLDPRVSDKNMLKTKSSNFVCW